MLGFRQVPRGSCRLATYGCGSSNCVFSQYVIHAINKAAVTTNLIFRPRRYQLTAKSYRHARNDASSLWNEYTAEMAA
jgi:hypothetical protein